MKKKQRMNNKAATLIKVFLSFFIIRFLLIVTSRIKCDYQVISNLIFAFVYSVGILAIYGRNVAKTFIRKKSIFCVIVFAIASAILCMFVPIADCEKSYLVFVLCIVPIFEELYFRKSIVTKMNESFHPAVGIIMSALLFSFSHGDIRSAVWGLIAGIILATVYVFTKSTTICIIIHFINNMAFLLFAK